MIRFACAEALEQRALLNVDLVGHLELAVQSYRQGEIIHATLVYVTRGRRMSPTFKSFYTTVALSPTKEFAKSQNAVYAQHYVSYPNEERRTGALNTVDKLHPWFFVEPTTPPGLYYVGLKMNSGTSGPAESDYSNNEWWSSAPIRVVSDARPLQVTGSNQSDKISLERHQIDIFTSPSPILYKVNINGHAREYVDLTVSSVDADAGNDQIAVDAGYDHISITGGSGNDFIQINSGGVYALGGAGHDTMRAYHGDGDGVTLSGGGGRDDLQADLQADVVYGGPGNDRLDGSGLLSGGSGDDTLYASGYTQRAYGGSGNDSLYGTFYGSSNVTLDGQSGRDSFYYHAYTIYGGSGNDTYYDDGYHASTDGVELTVLNGG